MLKGQESLEPLLLRIAIAQKMLRDPGLEQSSERLAAAFAAEAQRGDGVHRREEARFLLEVRGDPRAALAAALENWKVQREADDVLVLMRAAKPPAHPRPRNRRPTFVREHRLRTLASPPRWESGHEWPIGDRAVGAHVSATAACWRRQRCRRRKDRRGARSRAEFGISLACRHTRVAALLWLLLAVVQHGAGAHCQQRLSHTQRRGKQAVGVG